MSLFKFLISIVLANLVASGAYAQGNPDDIQECIDVMDMTCIFELNLEMFETTDAKPLLEDGRSPSLSTMQLMFSLEEILSDVAPSKGREYVERALTMVEDKHGQTALLRADLNIFLYEQCVAQGDSECVENTGQFLCKNAQNLAAPYIYKPAKNDEMLQRFSDVIVAQGCEEEVL